MSELQLGEIYIKADKKGTYSTWNVVNCKKKKASLIQHLFLSSPLPIPDLFTSISDNLYTSMLQGPLFRCEKPIRMRFDDYTEEEVKLLSNA